jgi:hypothetical protein
LYGSGSPPKKIDPTDRRSDIVDTYVWKEQGRGCLCWSWMTDREPCTVPWRMKTSDLNQVIDAV